MSPEKPKKLGRRAFKVNSNKIIDKLTYVPERHKQKFVNKLRQKLAQKPSLKPSSNQQPSSSLKIGSININGLDLEAHWAVQELLNEHKFDVSNMKICK